MTYYIGLDVSQKMTAICIVDSSGRRLWRGQCPTDPEQIRRVVTRHGGEDVRVGLETGPMTPWLVHELRGFGLDITCLDARHARAALRMQILLVAGFQKCRIRPQHSGIVGFGSGEALLHGPTSPAPSLVGLGP
jgi:transposase